MENIMKKILIITLLSLGIISVEAKGSFGGAFAGSLVGSSLSTGISNSNSGNCDRIKAQIKKYEEKYDELHEKNLWLSKQLIPHRGKFEELEDDFEYLFDYVNKDL